MQNTYLFKDIQLKIFSKIDVMLDHNGSLKFHWLNPYRAGSLGTEEMNFILVIIQQIENPNMIGK